MHTHQFQQAAEAGDNIEKYAQRPSDWFEAGTCYYAVAPYYQPTPMYQKSKAAFQKLHWDGRWRSLRRFFWMRYRRMT